MSTILKALRRLEDDDPKKKPVAEADVLRARILAEEAAARAAADMTGRPGSNDSDATEPDMSSRGPRSAIRPGALRQPLVLGAGALALVGLLALVLTQTTLLESSPDPADPTNTQPSDLAPSIPAAPTDGLAVAPNTPAAAQPGGPAMAMPTAAPSAPRAMVAVPTPLASGRPPSTATAPAPPSTPPSMQPSEQPDTPPSTTAAPDAAVVNVAASTSKAGTASNAVPNAAVAPQPAATFTPPRPQAAPAPVREVASAPPPPTVKTTPQPAPRQATPVESLPIRPAASEPPPPTPTPAPLPSRELAAATPAPSPAIGSSPPQPDLSSTDSSPAPRPAPTNSPAPSSTTSPSSTAAPVEVPPPDVQRVAPVSLPDVTVLRTAWHPKPERRSAKVRLTATDETLTVHEGDSVAGLVLQEITPSSVVFSANGVEVRRRVGESAGAR